MPMSAQLNLSKEYIANLKDAVREEKADSTLSNSLHLVSAGNNDIAISYYFTRLWLALGFAAYSDLLIDAASNFTKNLYALGPGNIAVLCALPLGCLPSARALRGSKCIDSENAADLLFN
ncbi:hypothetical protein CDL15_Pgr021319 [Punica granatum]|nr:hypothetical protein CDL15_Pgr021319 [Punica granatum]